MTYRFSNRIAAAVFALTSTVCFAGIPSGAGRLPGAGPQNAPGTSNLNKPGSGDDQDDMTGVFPPQSRPYGQTYGDWSAEWWQWILSIPTPANPNLERTKNNCGEGQSGDVWFLPGSFGAFIERTCRIPSGKALLLPLPNAIAGAGVGDCLSPGWGNPDPCGNWKALYAVAASLVDPVTKLRVTIDGVAVRDLNTFRFQSDKFTYTLPHDNILAFLFGAAIPAGKYKPAVSDGYWLMLKPLAPGKHTIHIQTVNGGVSDGGDLTLVIER
jgi:hypothetical protein